MRRSLVAAGMALLLMFPSAVCAQEEGTEEAGQRITEEQIRESPEFQELSEVVTVLEDCEVLDFPGRKDGQPVGEILEFDEVERTASINGSWSRITFSDMDGANKTGYVPTGVLDVETPETEGNITEVDGDRAGALSPSSGEGIFAQAAESVTGGVAEENGIQVGTPVAASSDASLVPLGTFRITHYCPCSICCGPWANGITSTGVTAITNHTIAVDPTQIPYGSQVVINGQVYVAEDCGGAIKTNCIDIYVASHEEGENKGVYYTDVYLIQ